LFYEHNPGEEKNGYSKNRLAEIHCPPRANTFTNTGTAELTKAPDLAK